MIYTDRKNLSIPFDERIIGHFGDNLVDTLSFEINEKLSGNYKFVLYISFYDGKTNSIILEKGTEDNIYYWSVKAEQIFTAGIAYIQIKAISESGEIWHSPKATVEFLESIDGNEVSGSYSPTVFEQLDKKINEVYEYVEDFKNSLDDLLENTLDENDYITRPEAEELIAESIDNLLLPLNQRLDGENVTI